MELVKGAWKKMKKKLTSVSFMYACVAENAELLVFFLLFYFIHAIYFKIFPVRLGKKVKVLVFRECMYV